MVRTSSRWKSAEFNKHRIKLFVFVADMQHGDIKVNRFTTKRATNLGIVVRGTCISTNATIRIPLTYFVEEIGETPLSRDKKSEHFVLEL